MSQQEQDLEVEAKRLSNTEKHMLAFHRKAKMFISLPRIFWRQPQGTP